MKPKPNSSRADHLLDQSSISAASPMLESKELKELREWRNVYGRASSAGDWAAAHRWAESDKPRETADDIRAKLMLSPNDLVLEVGCGSGAMLSHVLRDGQPGVGLDQCEALIRRAADFGVDLTRIRLGVSDASRLPVASESFDRVLCYSVFQCFPSERYTKRVLAEMVRVCRPGGVIVIGDLHGVMEKQIQFLERSGLTRRRADTLLRPFAFFWKLRQRIGKKGDGLRRRAFSHSFFRRVLRPLHCDVEFLRQETLGRPYLKLRYDLRIRKHATSQARHG